MSTAVIAAVAAVGLVLVAVPAAVWHRHRARRHASTERSLGHLSRRLDALSGELLEVTSWGDAVGAHPSPRDDLRSAPDLDALAARTLAAARGLEGVDAATIELLPGTPHAVRDAAGVDPGAAVAVGVAGPPDGRSVASVTTAYTYPPDAEPPGALRCGLTVPLAAEPDEIGVLAVFSYDPAFSSETIAEVERLARSVALAARAVRRRPPQTRARSPWLHDRLTWEVASARRSQELLALLLLAVDRSAVAERLGLLPGDDAGTAATTWVGELVRRSDTTFRLGPDELAVVLPDATHEDARRLHERIAHLLGVAPGTPGGEAVCAGIAELRQDDDAVSLFQRADAELDAAKPRAAAPMAVRGARPMPSPTTTARPW